MYLYTDFDQQLVNERVAQFRDQTERYLAGKLTEDELITEGGVLGMTLLLQHWLGVSPGVSGFLMDMTCYAVGFRLLGRGFLRNALISSVGFSLCYRLLERLGPVLPSMADRPLLAALAGGLFVGVGVGLVVRAGGAAGGDDALALIIARISRLPISLAYFFTDFTVLALSLSYIPLEKIACSLVTVTLSSWLIGRIQSFHVHS